MVTKTSHETAKPLVVTTDLPHLQLLNLLSLFLHHHTSVLKILNSGDYSLSYCTTDDAYDLINQMSPDTLLLVK